VIKIVAFTAKSWGMANISRMVLEIGVDLAG
jgi:hypothetical protein